jgi:hypothetical protein
MQLLGFKVAAWRIKEVRKKLGYCWLDKNGRDKAMFIKELEEILKNIEAKDIKEQEEK